MAGIKDVLTYCKKRTYKNSVICTPDKRIITLDGLEIRNFKIESNIIMVQYKHSKIYETAPEKGYFVFTNQIIIADRIIKRIKNSKTILDEKEYLDILKEVLNYEFLVFPEKDLQDYLFKIFMNESEQNKIRKVIWNRK